METPQLHSAIRTPDINSRYRTLFEQHYRVGNTPEVRYLSIGSEIEKVQGKIYGQITTPSEAWDIYFKVHKKGLEQYVSTQAKLLHHSDNTSADLPHRAQLHTMLVDQHILLPILFSANVDDYEARTLRQKLIQDDGIYGIVGEQIESVYEALTNVPQESDEASALIGLLNEETSLAVANLGQNANIVALPALPYDDWSGNTDLLFYGYAQKVSFIYRRHVKSNERSARDALTDPTCIGGIALGNSRLSHQWRATGSAGGLLTSKAIIDHINARATKTQESILDAIHVDMLAAVRGGRGFIERKPHWKIFSIQQST